MPAGKTKVPKAKVKMLKGKNVKSMKSKVVAAPKLSPNAKMATKRKMSKRGKLIKALNRFGRGY